MSQPKLPIDQHRKATGMRLPKPLFAALTAYSETHRYRRTEIIETAIREFLESKGAYPVPSNSTAVASQSVSVVSPALAST